MTISHFMNLYAQVQISIHCRVFSNMCDKVYTRGVQIIMQLGKYLAFNHDLHEIGTCIV